MLQNNGPMENSNKHMNGHLLGRQPNERKYDDSIPIQRNLQSESVIPILPTTMAPTTFSPSSHPSSYPTTFPSSHPTIHASSEPSTMPSSYPTTFPSTHPTSFPSAYPTSFPSTYPTVFPSTYPTVIPSAYPTTFPSSYPSSHPTSMLTSLHPSGVPSQSSTSMHPSVQPSVHVTSVQPVSDAPVGEVVVPNPDLADPSSALSSTSSSPPPVMDFPGYFPDNSTTTDTDKGINSVLISGVVFASVVTFLIAAVGVHRMRSRRKKKEVYLSDSILRGGRLPIKYTDDDSPLMMVEVRNSTTGGWHGFYGEDQLQSIDFGRSSSEEQQDNVRREEEALLADGGLEEIESTNYAIGELDHLSDEDLVKAYHEAMAVDVESEDEMDIAMQGVGSPSSDKERHEII
ncbi:hypothetical protein ACHAWU_008975 [Discostella pseudostelligera]|uniref:Circumsporozoite protein n=1 Tax=Discostella pseudostelligera TaxID=259834 RepID=A0ABD3MI45_9STRA